MAQIPSLGSRVFYRAVVSISWYSDFIIVVWGAATCTLHTSVFYDVAAVCCVRCWCLWWWMWERKSHPNNCFPLNAHTSLFSPLLPPISDDNNSKRWHFLELDLFTNIHSLQATQKIWKLYSNLFQRSNLLLHKKCQAWKWQLILVSKYFTESEQLGYFSSYIFWYLHIFLPSANQAETCIWESLKILWSWGTSGTTRDAKIQAPYKN